MISRLLNWLRGDSAHWAEDDLRQSEAPGTVYKPEPRPRPELPAPANPLAVELARELASEPPGEPVEELVEELVEEPVSETVNQSTPETAESPADEVQFEPEEQPESLIRNKYLREDTGTHETLKILDDSLLDTGEEEGFDPYNTGDFDRSRNWERRFKS